MWGMLTRPRCAALLLMVAAVLAHAAPASAHRMHIHELIIESGAQRTWVHSMAADIMRLALKIDERGSLDRLQETRQRMADSIQVMRVGGEELRDRGTDAAAEILATVGEEARLWAAFDAALVPVLETGAVSAAQSEELLALNAAVADTVERLHVIYYDAANHYGVVTVLARAVMIAERERAIGQRMTSTFLAVAQRAGAEDRIALDNDIGRFEEHLSALAYGDPELGLIPAPTEELRRQWMVVDAVWRQMKPMLEAAVAGERQRRADVDRLSGLGARLTAELGRAGDMLSSLMPGGRS